MADDWEDRRAGAAERPFAAEALIVDADGGGPAGSVADA
jgi:hypothetical protein